MKSTFCNPRVSRFALFLVCASLAAPVLCDPPSHAPAHGWRKKNDPYYEGYTGRKWNNDYGVRQGRCDAQGIAAALGAQAGAEIGSAVGGDTGAIIGTVAGVLIGAQADREMGIVDRGCVSHALDIGADDVAVHWTDPDTRKPYSLTPRAARRIGGQECRDFDWGGGARQTACANADGSWTIR